MISFRSSCCGPRFRRSPIGQLALALFAVGVVSACSSDDAQDQSSAGDDALILESWRPQVAITSPLAGQTVATGVVKVTGSASDAQSRPANVEVRVDDGPYIAASTSNNYANWSATVSITTPGSHKLTARAKDMAGNPNWATRRIQVSSAIVDSGAAPAPSPSTPPPAPSTPPSPTPSPSNVYDDFNSGNYTIGDGRTTPNSKWFVTYAGYGQTGVKTNNEGKSVFFQKQPVPNGPSTVVNGNETTGTSSALVESTQAFRDFKVSLDVRTLQSMRPSPNGWEVAWFFFRHDDAGHHYYFYVGYDGWELGKKDVPVLANGMASVEKQHFLKTGTTKKVQLGVWAHWDIIAVGNHITVYVDNTKIADIVDDGSLRDYQGMIPAMNAMSYDGKIAMYNEDASVEYDNIVVTPM